MKPPFVIIDRVPTTQETKMLTQEHIDWYVQDILRAQKASLGKIATAERLALRMSCKGRLYCRYCQAMANHKEILEKTVADLLLLTSSLVAGTRPSRSFPKKMYPGVALYRGFITDTGEYVDMFNVEHSEYRKEYSATYGEDRAYRMIHVYAQVPWTRVQFFDRKYPPNTEQYTTLRELMTDAEGSLCFDFEYETKHPV